MEFSRRKLPKEATQSLRICPIESVRAYAFMLAPVYVYMQKNEKFVAVKAPLDFFTPDDLERLKPFGTFFLPEFVDQALPFREAGRSVRALLLGDRDGMVMPLAPSPYELSDACLRMIGPLWNSGAMIEPFFIATFVNELCEVLDGDLLRSARDLDIRKYEEAIFLSSWAVFLALHLGQCSLEHLGRLRVTLFRATVQHQSIDWANSDDYELHTLAAASLEASGFRQADGAFFANRPERIALRIVSRLKRIREQMSREGDVSPTIYGEKGFADAA